MAKRTHRARSTAARKGWITRRKRKAQEFRRRSKASKKGWRRRRAKTNIEKRALEKPKAKRGPLYEWMVKWSYSPQNGRDRIVDFTVIAQSKEDAELFVVKAVSNGQDSEGTDLTWMLKIPWDEIFTMKPEEGRAGDEALNKKEIKALGKGWVTIT